MGSMENINTLSGEAEFPCHVAKPGSGNAKAAIIVIQEIFGVNKGIKAKCDRWASLGYLAVAPDLFWRVNDGTDLDADVEAEFQQALDLMGQFDQDQGIRDIEATIHYAQNAIGNHNVGCVGYCLGGRLAFMTACRTDIRASVGYYGVGIDGLLGEKHAIAHEVMLHIPTADGFVPADAQAAMHSGLDDHPKVTLHDYEGLDHGFAAEFGERRDDAAATLADQRTEAFFKEHLA
ncbi:dienelactone hydrolase family protein [Parasphingorhabdus halotolerans]|uniref:Dienelactone hydrolase family protein n=1 Tax=Parasphingorhabdus halotolerans TaxID=2725558 RepID=A0A6H2DPI7_9SPHN|nr:dienelactone hydrolase family protein [Parasphingorhabdus halotolerans]QJB69671.1 dienelactone hydrolase family protein [Parasphingorhabdus halotolerans]